MTKNHLEQNKVMRIRFNLDALGVCASTLCMVHCLVFPLLLAALPLWSLSADTGDTEVAERLASHTPTTTHIGSEKRHVNATEASSQAAHGGA